MTQQAPQTSQGFTLIEFVIVIAVLAIVASTVGPLLYQSTLASNRAEQRTQFMKSAGWALERLSREWRGARVQNGIELKIASQSLSFRDLSGKLIEYRCDKKKLLRNEIVINDQLSQCTFNYYQADGSTADIPETVRYMKATLTAQQNADSITLSTLIFPRNIYAP